MNLSMHVSSNLNLTQDVNYLLIAKAFCRRDATREFTWMYSQRP